MQSDGGYHLLSGSDDSTIKVWNVEGGECESTLTGHTSSVEALTNLNGEYFASGGGASTVKVWKFNEIMPCVKTIEGHENCVRALASMPSDGLVLVSGSDDATVKL